MVLASISFGGYQSVEGFEAWGDGGVEIEVHTIGWMLGGLKGEPRERGEGKAWLDEACLLLILASHPAKFERSQGMAIYYPCRSSWPKRAFSKLFFLALCNTGDKCEHVSGEFGDIMTLLA
jgi:hypothetical protein